MNRILVCLYILWVSHASLAATLTQEQERLVRAEYPTETLYQLWLSMQQDQHAAVNFYNSLSDHHIIEPRTGEPNAVNVTYFALGDQGTDYFMQSGGPDFYGLRFRRLGTSNLFFCVQKVPADAWFTYGINQFDRKALTQPSGLFQTSMTHVYDGAVIGPNAPLSPAVVAREDVPQGELIELTLNSEILRQTRKLQVYVPANYDPGVQHNLVLQFDGQNFAAAPGSQEPWRAWTPMPTILDNLIHQQQIGPTIAILIHNQGMRSSDLIDEKMTDFVALELVAWARTHYNIAPSPQAVVVSGPSRAGFTAARTAFRHAPVVGAVLSQSGSFYYTLKEQENWPVYPEFEGQLVLDYKQSAKRDIHFYLDVGLYDLGLGAVGYNRQLRDVLELKGYPVTYYQYNGGHSHLGWRHTLARGLVALLGEGMPDQ